MCCRQQRGDGHHSVTTFDGNAPIQLIRAVREFKFVNPHASTLEVAGEDAPPVILEP
jgi:hypothetical protein